MPNPSKDTTSEERPAQTKQIEEDRLKSPVEITTENMANPVKDKDVLENGLTEEINCTTDTTDVRKENKDVEQEVKDTSPSLRSSIAPLSESGKAAGVRCWKA